jgi:hypothetical protein
LGQQGQFVLVEISNHPLGDHARGQAEEAQEFGNREAATWLLDALLREYPLIVGSVRHGEAGSINNTDGVSTPQIPLEDTLLCVPD